MATKEDLFAVLSDLRKNYSVKDLCNMFNEFLENKYDDDFAKALSLSSQDALVRSEALQVIKKLSNYISSEDAEQLKQSIKGARYNGYDLQSDHILVEIKDFYVNAKGRWDGNQQDGIITDLKNLSKNTKKAQRCVPGGDLTGYKRCFALKERPGAMDAFLAVVTKIHKVTDKDYEFFKDVNFVFNPEEWTTNNIYILFI